MGKPRNYQVGKSSAERNASRMTITLPNSALDQVRLNSAARRQAAIDAGMLNANKGGVHDPGKKGKHKRDRRDTRNAIRRGEW